MHGQVIGVVGIGQDITARLAQEREYSKLIDNANAPIFGVDTQGELGLALPNHASLLHSLPPLPSAPTRPLWCCRIASHYPSPSSITHVKAALMCGTNAPASL